MAAQTWNIDPSHSHIQFAVRHMVISKVRGRFNKFSGSLSFDPAAPDERVGPGDDRGRQHRHLRREA